MRLRPSLSPGSVVVGVVLRAGRGPDLHVEARMRGARGFGGAESWGVGIGEDDKPADLGGQAHHRHALGAE